MTSKAAARITPDAAWRRWLDVALAFVGLDEFAVFQQRPAAVPAVRLDEHNPPATRQVAVSDPPPGPPDLPVTIRPPR